MKKIVTLGILMICLLVAVRMTTFANAESIEEVSFVDADDVVDEKNVERGDSGIIEDMFQVRHYANKLSGKLHYDSFMQFLEFYKRIFDINGTFKTEGKVVF